MKRFSFLSLSDALKGARARNWAAAAPICFRCREGKLDVSELVVALAGHLLHVFWEVPPTVSYAPGIVEFIFHL